jgi:formylglycine-generating enzyme required for sulfatase activity
MFRRALVVAIGAASAVSGCGNAIVAPPAPGQLLVYFDTDAIVPRGTAGKYGALEPYPLFDHVRFDVDVPGVTCDCTRDFDIDEAKINAGEVSFGVVASPGRSAGGGTLRVRLFRYGDTEGGEPREESTVDVTFAIGAIPGEGPLAKTAFLATEDVGKRLGGDEPVPLADGRPERFHAGTWAGGARIDCADTPREGEVCVPGGAFWMGSALEARRSDRSGAQRLAVVSPFFLSATEVTVAAFRRSGLDATPWSRGKFGNRPEDHCTFTETPGPFEEYPINCLHPLVARSYCRRDGADLPSEAQLEYVAGALRSAAFVWGTDPPTCEGVTMCRQGGTAIAGDSSCRELGTIGGAAKVGSGLLDRLVLPTGTIVDLIGNVSEMARDEWSRLVEPCWSRSGLYVDPVCTTRGRLDPGPLYPLRGGTWVATPNRASGRFYTDRGSPLHGFRCARGGPRGRVNGLQSADASTGPASVFIPHMRVVTLRSLFPNVPGTTMQSAGGPVRIDSHSSCASVKLLQSPV